MSLPQPRIKISGKYKRKSRTSPNFGGIRMLSKAKRMSKLKNPTWNRTNNFEERQAARRDKI